MTTRCQENNKQTSKNVLLKQRGATTFVRMSFVRMSFSPLKCVELQTHLIEGRSKRLPHSPQESNIVKLVLLDGKASKRMAIRLTLDLMGLQFDT